MSPLSQFVGADKSHPSNEVVGEQDEGGFPPLFLTQEEQLTSFLLAGLEVDNSS